MDHVEEERNRQNDEGLLMAVGINVSGEKIASGFWQGSSVTHEICAALFLDLKHCHLAPSQTSYSPPMAEAG